MFFLKIENTVCFVTFGDFHNSRASFVLFQWFNSFLLLVTTEYVSYHPLWTSGRASGQPFVLKGTIFYPEETVMYPQQNMFIVRNPYSTPASILWN